MLLWKFKKEQDQYRHIYTGVVHDTQIFWLEELIFQIMFAFQNLVLDSIYVSRLVFQKGLSQDFDYIIYSVLLSIYNL